MPTTGLFPKPAGKIVDRFLAHNLAEDVTPNASASTGLKVEHSGVGALRVTRVVFTNHVLATTDAGANGAHASVKLFDWPEALVRNCGVGYSLSIEGGGTASGLDDDAEVVLSVGTTEVADTNATLTTTEADLVPSVAATLVAGVDSVTGYSTGSQIVALTDSSGGTASDTLAAITGSYVEATIENTVASLAAKINELVAKANASQATLMDGTGTAKSAYLNFAVPAADHGAVADTITVNGEIVFVWINQGDAAA